MENVNAYQAEQQHGVAGEKNLVEFVVFHNLFYLFCS
jgi:hypothetical protein